MTSVRLFNRVLRVTVDTTMWEFQRAQFRATKTNTGDPNSVDIRLTNLSPASRKATQVATAAVLLESGWRADDGTEKTETLFIGDLRIASSRRDGPDWVTTVQAADGEKARRSSRVSFGLGKGAMAHQAYQKLLGSLQNVDTTDLMNRIASGDIDGAFDEFSSGFAVDGLASEEIETMARSAGYSFSVQDGKAQMVKTKSGQPLETTKEDFILLSPSTGLIGSPEIGRDGLLSAKSMLNPGIRPGRGLTLQSEMFNGNFRIEKVIHDGDTHGQTWQSAIEARPL